MADVNASNRSGATIVQYRRRVRESAAVGRPLEARCILCIPDLEKIP
jgi:hypothetical protein